ncbi:RDD family protein [Microbacterium aureliae]
MPAVDGPAPARPARALVEIHQDEVLTGEAVALDVQPLGFFLRGLGALIDIVIGVAALIVFAIVAVRLVEGGLLAESTVPILTIVVLVLVTVVLPTAVETSTGGRSLGRLAVGGRIVRTDGGGAGFRHALIRALVGVFELWFTFGAVAALVGAFTPRSQRLGDLVAGTYSERTRTPNLPPASPGVPPQLAGWAQTADVARLPDALARRLSQFAANAAHMEPGARARLAAALGREAAAFVSPIPAADPETLVRAVVAVRRDRELRALQLQQARVGALLGRAGPGASAG